MLIIKEEEGDSHTFTAFIDVPRIQKRRRRLYDLALVKGGGEGGSSTAAAPE